MKPKHALFLIFCFLGLIMPVSGQQLEQPILLWPGGAPGATGTTAEDMPAIIPFLPERSKLTGAAVLVIPGGGFTLRATDHEGVLVAQWLKEHGITAFLLRYRLRPIYSRNDWLLDGQRALQYIRAHSSEYHISTERLGAIGFSAGANLCADMAFSAAPGMADAADPLDQYPTNPDFLILAYGSKQLSDTISSYAKTHLPPTFIFGTAEDKGSLKGLVSLQAQLIAADVPCETHIFQQGVHGIGFGIGDPTLGEWPKLMINWLKINGILSPQKRIPLAGVVNLDGLPLVRGIVILTPVEDPNAGTLAIYITNTGTGQPGRFEVPASQGGIAGKYRVEVREEATRWTSNSRHPFMIEMRQKEIDGTLTDADIVKWSAFVRDRDLSPSINNQRVYAHRHPMDREDYIMDIQEGKDILIEVFSK
jgi:acetyl esterase/lipase